MNDTHSHGTRMSTIDCQASVISPGCSSKLTLNHGDLVLNPKMDYCETRPEPFVAKVQLNPSLQQVFESLPPPSAEFNMSSQSEVRKARSVLTSVRIELADLLEVHTLDFDKLHQGRVILGIQCDPVEILMFSFLCSPPTLILLFMSRVLFKLSNFPTKQPSDELAVYIFAHNFFTGKTEKPN